MSRKFRTQLRNRERLNGTMITLASTTSAEILAQAGFDWFFIDGEHSSLSSSEIQRILQAISHRAACVVRVPESGELTIKKVLDIGADGIIVPQVNTADQAADIVRWAKYPPLGSRGVGLARAHGYGAKFKEYLETANETVAVVIQAENIQAVENLEAIVRVPGIDAIQLGPYDLSASMGKTGQIDDPEVVAAIDRIYSVAATANLPIGCFGVTAKHVQGDIEKGSTLVCAGVDSAMLSHAASSILNKLKAE